MKESMVMFSPQIKPGATDSMPRLYQAERSRSEGRMGLLLPGRLEVVNAQLVFIIRNIYGVRDFQIVDAPKWIVDWNFAIPYSSEGQYLIQRRYLLGSDRRKSAIAHLSVG
jgi:hypothetical protein